uniref:F-box protein Hrt3/FBXO9 C-terminal domain-containing protein n=1 Tax=Hyaloperonospora arabidopsidis (strain Emoy2) TaxID=559515 RepID=M4BBF8_HYAAE
MAEILHSEDKRRRQIGRKNQYGHVQLRTATNGQELEQQQRKEEENGQEGEGGDDDSDDDIEGVKGPFSHDSGAVPSAKKSLQDEEEEIEEDPNEHHTMLNLADILLIDILKWLDEDCVGICSCTCKRLLHVARSEILFEAFCRRIYPVQNPRAAVAVARNKFGLRRFATWFNMFHDRPRVRYNGFYWLKVSYYKKPELSMWTDIVPGTILKCIYYRYFSFQRDGTVLYGMLFKAPHDAEAYIRNQRKGVYSGRFYVDKNELMVTVPTNCNEVNFRLTITQRERGRNVKLVLQEHFASSEPDGNGRISYYDTAEEKFYYYQLWNL